jgi:hypothetical protein
MRDLYRPTSPLRRAAAAAKRTANKPRKAPRPYVHPKTANAVRYEFRGESLTAADWAERAGFPESVVRGRLCLGWPIERALLQPARAWPNRVPTIQKSKLAIDA